jgi:histidine triad (HIT) family protein
MMNESTECVFCQILAREVEASIVYEDDLCSAFMDIQPVNRGHVLVVPNRHVSEATALTEAESARVFVVAQRVNRALRKIGVKCEGINYFVADGEAAGQEVFHVHLHIFPRFKGDGFLVLPPDYETRPTRDDLDELAVLIKNKL